MVVRVVLFKFRQSVLCTVGALPWQHQPACLGEPCVPSDKEFPSPATAIWMKPLCSCVRDTRACRSRTLYLLLLCPASCAAVHATCCQPLLPSPSLSRFNYDGYYDDCALRNVTEAAQANGTDYAIDLDTVNQLPDTVPYNPATDNIMTYNATLYNETGLIIDSPYCNYTQIGGGGSAAVRAVGALWHVVWAMMGMAVATAVAQMG